MIQLYRPTSYFFAPFVFVVLAIAQTGTGQQLAPQNVDEALAACLRLGTAARNINKSDLEVSVEGWSSAGNLLYFTIDGALKEVNLQNGAITIAEQKPEGLTPSLPVDKGPLPRWSAGRARQASEAVSPEGKRTAVYRDFNLFIRESDGSEKQITSDGNERHRYGTCCWVYGEELDQSEAMWWDGSGENIVFYEVIEDGMKDYYLTVNNTGLYTEVEAVRYPKTGDPNPQVNLMVHNLNSGETRRLTIEGEERQYLYNLRFAPDGKTLLVNRTNRRQDVLDVMAVNILTGEVRTVLTERQSTWQENSPRMQFLADGQRFIWESEANGWRHFQLRNLGGELLVQLSSSDQWPCEKIVLIDESANWFYYSANSDDNPYNAQLHRVRLDGSEPSRLTGSPLNHTEFMISPDHKYVCAVRQSVEIPPQHVIYNFDQPESEIVIASGTAAQAEAEGLSPAEWFSFTADDGATVIHGILRKPPGFDPSRKYPLLIDVYGGPNSRGLNNDYSPATANAGLDVVVAKIGNRGTTGRGKAFESSTYLKLGQADIADQAAAARFLGQREYIDSTRTGIYGHSYGGYMSALGILKYPEVFSVAVAGAPVTDFRNYDTIYTERYMRTPQENESGYIAGSCIPRAGNLKGKLLIVHGLIDDNVHPANTWQLAEELQKLDKPFDMMIYPNFQHGIRSNYTNLVRRYLFENLNPARAVNKP